MPLFESAHAHLKAGASAPETRSDVEAGTGELCEMITGGGIAVRMRNGRVKSVPAVVRAADLEILQYMAVTSIAGEHQDAGWWMRVDQFDAASDSNAMMKRSWLRVDTGGLPKPLYAPGFPGAAGAKESWVKLLDHVVHLHNTGKLTNFITHGAREAAWDTAVPNVFPTLLAIREANASALKRESYTTHAWPRCMLRDGEGSRVAVRWRPILWSVAGLPRV